MQDSAVNLHVRVADAQGLRLQRGGEIRLVITLRATDDPVGEAFGAKVTPWLTVPEDEAPQWKARGAIFAVPVGRCCQADFQDSAHLHISLMQRGHAAPPGEKVAEKPPPKSGLGWAALKQKGNAALHSASSSLHSAWPLGGGGSGTTARGEEVGALWLPVGRRLACPDGGLAEECSEWLQLISEQPSDLGGEAGRKVKGCLFLEIAAVASCPPDDLPTVAAPPPPAMWAGSPVGSDGEASAASQPHAAEDASRREPVDQAEYCGGPPPLGDDPSESASESGDAPSDAASGSGGQAPVGGAAARTAAEAEVVDDIEPEEIFVPPSPAPDLLSPRALAELLASAGPGVEPRASRWLPFGRAAPAPSVADGFDTDASYSIFAANDEGSGAQSSRPGRLQRLLQKWAHPRKQIRPLKQRVRSTLDPGVRRQRREVRKWRQWHEVFCILNDLERRLSEAVDLLVQAAASMRRFGESHAALQDVPRLSAFLGDAALYFRSEADVPERLEAHLDDIERLADEFRGISVEPANGSLEGGGGPPVELSSACEDLQVDVAVLLESALMAAQQALAEYKRMHCRLELLATEYEPICRLELECQTPVLLPLLTERADQAAAASLPEQAVQWALDFSQLVGTASKALHRLVRELEHRRSQLKECSDELRSVMLRCAACGAQPREGAGPGG